MDKPTLLSLRKDAQAELSKLSTCKLDEEEDVKTRQLARITKLQSEVDSIDIALGELADATLNTTDSGDTHGYEMNRIMSSIRCALDQVGKFKPSGLINQFCNRVNPIHKMYVRGKHAAHPTLEAEFTSLVVFSLPFPTQNKFSDEKTWAALQAKVKGHFQADISIFQHLSKVWSLQDQMQGRVWNDQCSKLTSTVNESKANIKAYYTSKGKTLSADDVFGLISAMLMAESVKANSPEVYPMMLDALDSCSSAEDVAKKAGFYTDRLDSSDASAFFVKTDRAKSRPSTHKPSGVYSGSQPRASKELVKACIRRQLCIKFNTPEGCKATNCQYKHILVDTNSEQTTSMPIQVASWTEDNFPEESFQ